MSRAVILPLFAAFTAAIACAAAEEFVHAPVTGVSMFKNGMTMVTRTIENVPNGPFLLKDDIRPVHGTLWFEPSDGIDVSSVKVTETEKVKTPLSFSSMLKKLSGREVEITYLSGSVPVVVRGTLLPDTDVNAYAIREPDGAVVILNSSCPVIALRVRDGQLPAPEETEKTTEKNVWRILKRTRSAGPLRFHYLTRGMTWAPAYRIDLTDPKTLQIGQSMLIANDLEDMKNADSYLVSGYPYLLFSNVTSPLSAGVDLNSFFSMLNGIGSSFYNPQASVTSQIMMNSTAPLNRFSPAAATGAEISATGKTEDIHFTPAGPLTLARGERLYRAMEKSTAPYERIVEWIIPDGRNEYGYTSGHNDGSDPSGERWDAVRFINPLSAPITTAPLEFTANGRLLAQNQTNWVNPGQPASFHITKALSVTGSVSETEDSSKRTENIRIGGYLYRMAVVNGSVQMRNYRNEAVKLSITLGFSGKLISSEGKSETRSLQSGVWTVNPRNELHWEIELPSQGSRELQYSYSVLIRN